MKVRIPYVCVSHIGNRRGSNQDNYICGRRYRDRDMEEMEAPLTGCIDPAQPSVLGIFDGMGGEEHGEIASLLAAQEASNITIRRNPSKALLEFCMKANEEICEYTEQHHFQSMGTTAAMAVFSRRDITLCNIGDSKIFSYEEENLVQLSHDHLAAAPHGMKQPLSQCLGIPPDEMTIDPYIASREYKDGEWYLFCSDGLTDMVSNAEITGILQSACDIQNTGEKLNDTAGKLLDLALDHGGRDNITVILCMIEASK